MPDVVQSTSGQSSGAVTDVVMAYPSGLTTDNLFLWLIWGSGTSGTYTKPIDYNELHKNNFNLPRNYIIWKKLTGSEGADVTVVQSIAREASWIGLEIGPWDSTANPEISVVATGTDAAPDPDTLNPTGWDVELTLWLAHFLQDLDSGDSGAVNAVPTGYTSVADEIYAEVGVNAVAKRIASVASENPDAFTSAIADTWRAFTIGIRPGSDGGGGGAPDVTGTGTPAAQAATAAGSGDRIVDGSGTPAAQAGTVAGAGERTIDGTAVATAQSAVASGVGERIATVSLVLTAANNRELKNASGALVSNLSNIVWEWYDTPGSTSGNPVDSGTFNTDAAGEATISVVGSSLANGQFGQLIIYHPSDPDIRASLRVPVTD